MSHDLNEETHHFSSSSDKRPPEIRPIQPTSGTNLHDIKYHPDPVDGEDGILLVDMEAEALPEMDEDGNYLYYCNSSHTFTVDDEQSNYYSSWRRD